MRGGRFTFPTRQLCQAGRFSILTAAMPETGQRRPMGGAVGPFQGSMDWARHQAWNISTDHISSE
jgi:hypothetical protein